MSQTETLTQREIAYAIIAGLFEGKSRIAIADAVGAGEYAGVSSRTIRRVAHQGLRCARDPQRQSWRVLGETMTTIHLTKKGEIGPSFEDVQNVVEAVARWGGRFCGHGHRCCPHSQRLGVARPTCRWPDHGHDQQG